MKCLSLLVVDSVRTKSVTNVTEIKELLVSVEIGSKTMNILLYDHVNLDKQSIIKFTAGICEAQLVVPLDFGKHS